MSQEYRMMQDILEEYIAETERKRADSKKSFKHSIYRCGANINGQFANYCVKETTPACMSTIYVINVCSDKGICKHNFKEGLFICN